MRKFYLFLLLSVCFFQFNNNLIAQSNEHAVITEVNHDCGELGAIWVTLINPDNVLQYFWEHGPENLHIFDLEAGVYTFVIITIDGCREEYVTEILEVGKCNVVGNLTIIDECTMLINIQVTFDGVQIEENALDIVWSDGSNAGLSREVSRLSTKNYCVEITAAGGGEKCCLYQECFKVERNRDCKPDQRGKEIIVNEFSENTVKGPQYAEFLVLGNNECEETYDLRGHIIDDNNGLLIEANSFVTPFTTEGVGISPGYLFFTNHDNWAKVPNGSLILVLQAKTASDSNFPPLDPYDSDGDFVYVLTADDAELFGGMTSTWNDLESHMDYIGALSVPNWEKIQLKSEADGMQVRYPDGTYCHGVSRGTTAFADSTSFTLHITEESADTEHCQFFDVDYEDKNHFSCQSAQDSVQTPGKPNSDENAAMIAALIECKSELQNITDSGEEVINPEEILQRNSPQDELRVYPNPFSDRISIDFKAETTGTATIKILLLSGQESMSLKTDCRQGENSFSFKLENSNPSTLYILELTYPSGKKNYRRIVRMY